MKWYQTAVIYSGMFETILIENITEMLSAFRNYQNFFDVIAERPNPASENSEPIKGK